MTSAYEHYHPYRFSKIASALAARFSVTQNRDVGLDAGSEADILANEYQGMGNAEFSGRMSDYRLLIETRAKWASEGRQIFDMSSILKPLAGATDIAVTPSHNLVHGLLSDAVDGNPEIGSRPNDRSSGWLGRMAISNRTCMR